MDVTDETLPASFIRRDDEVTCWAVPNDGREDGPARASDSIPIRNATPTISGMSLLPDEPTTTDTLECTVASKIAT